jgi:hypothetical protein
VLEPRRTHGIPRAALSREVGAGATGTRGTPGATLHQKVGAGAQATHGGPRATLSREVGARAAGTRDAPGSALRRKVSARAQTTHGGPGATLSQEAGTTPPSPLLCSFVGNQGVVVPVTPPNNPHQMITRGKISFRVVPDRLVLTATTSSPTPSLIPSSARAALANPH